MKAARQIRFTRNISAHRTHDSGYAYLIVLFMIALMIAGSAILVTSLTTQARRQREEDAIWRGNQYARAIRLFFRKTGHYPKDMDELVKGLPELHFLRQKYKDPMNKEDGEWRLIYVNAAGQIIGSVRYASLQQMALMDLGPMQAGQQVAGLGVAASSLANPTNNLGSASGVPGAPGGNNNDNSSDASVNPPPGDSQDQSSDQSSSQPGQTPTSTIPTGGTPTQGVGGAGGLSGFTGQIPDAILTQKPTGAVDGPVLGGFLTGVGGTVDSKSLKVYRGGKKYKQWEFIWNPLEDAAANMQQGLSQQGTTQFGTPTGGMGGMMGQPQTQPMPQPQPPPQPNQQ